MISDFDYHRPVHVAEAVALRHRLGAGATYWAGGTDLLLQCKRGRAVTHCIDLTGLAELARVERQAAGIRIGALVPLSGLERFSAIDPYLRTIAETAGRMCTVQTRTLATIGGNLCNASPSADLAVVLTALGAVARVEGPKGRRDIPLDRFATAPGRTVLEPPELLTNVFVPLPDIPRASAYHRVARTVVDIALVGAAASVELEPDGRTIGAVRIALGAVGPRVLRAGRAEEMLRGQGVSSLGDAELLTRIGAAATGAATPISDIRASASYRGAMVPVLVRRCLSAIAMDLEAQAHPPQPRETDR